MGKMPSGGHQRSLLPLCFSLHKCKHANAIIGRCVRACSHRTGPPVRQKGGKVAVHWGHCWGGIGAGLPGWVNGRIHPQGLKTPGSLQACNTPPQLYKLPLHSPHLPIFYLLGSPGADSTRRRYWNKPLYCGWRKASAAVAGFVAGSKVVLSDIGVWTDLVRD